MVRKGGPACPKCARNGAPGRTTIDIIYTSGTYLAQRTYACHIVAHHSVDSDPRSVGCGSMESWWRRRFNTKRRRLLTAYGLFSYCSSNAVENAACIRGISTGGTYFEK